MENGTMTALQNRERHQYETPSQGASVLETLIAARKEIEREENWCTEFYENPSGSRCCSLGAIHRALGQKWHDGDEGHPAFLALEKIVGGYIGDFNDTHTHAEVLAAFDRAIEAERAKVSP